MDILEIIYQHKRVEVEMLKKHVPEEKFKHTEIWKRTPVSLKNALLNNSRFGIISEFKRKSPSKGIINKNANVQQVTADYCATGVAGISVLTDEGFFGGTTDDLLAARKAVTCPLLRKEFILDAYQITQAKALGADVILLIAAMLDKSALINLAKCAKDIGLEVLMEVHDESEIDYLNDYVDIVGVNNRNLKSFEVSVLTSENLIDKIPDQFVRISESGISNPETIIKLHELGYRGFLIGENFMKTNNPGLACNQFITDLMDKVAKHG